MRAITYRITLLEPTLATALEGDPNSAVAYEFLPGSVLRGAIIAKYLYHHNAKELDLNNPLVRSLFFDGVIRYLNGYLVKNDIRSLPTPHSWHRTKDEEASLYDFAIEEPDDKELRQKVPFPFCELRGDTARLLRPDRHISVHTTRTRRFGRAMPRDTLKEGEVEGAVYRYDALAAGQTFEAAVLCGRDTDIAILLRLLTGEAVLGGSRTGGYGRAIFPEVKEAGAGWREVGIPLMLHADGLLMITLLSDALIRNQNGQFSIDPEVVRSALSAQLKCPLVFQQAFLRGRVVGGFNRKWGLPLPQALAVEMGSVLVFRAPGCTESQLRELETQGIGERRAEGFGRLAVNWHNQAPRLQVDTMMLSLSITSRTLPQGTESEALAKQMVERMLRQRLDAALTERANTLAGSIREPSPSQLSRLQLVIRDAMAQCPDDGRTRLRDYLQTIKERQTARKQFMRDRIGNKSLLEWLQFRIDDITDIWQELGMREHNLPRIGNVVGTLSLQLAYEYNLRLIHEVLVLAAKEKRKEGR